MSVRNFKEDSQYNLINVGENKMNIRYIATAGIAALVGCSTSGQLIGQRSDHCVEERTAMLGDCQTEYDAGKKQALDDKQNAERQCKFGKNFFNTDGIRECQKKVQDDYLARLKKLGVTKRSCHSDVYVVAKDCQ